MPQTTSSALDLLGRLEALLREAGVRSGQRPLDLDDALGLLRLIKSALPADLKEAHRLRLEAERLFRQAQDEARRVVLEAQATAQRLTDPNAVLKDVAHRRQDLLAQVDRDARTVREGADAYAAQVLADLEESVLRVLEAIRKGRELLKGESG